MINLTHEEAQQVLDALEELNKLSIGGNAICLPAEIDDAMEILRARLAQPEPEPVAWLTDREEMYFDKEDARRYSDGFVQPLYTAPPQRDWTAAWIPTRGAA